MNKPREIRPAVRHLAQLMDTRFSVPGTPVRFGWDTLIGLLPVAGDTVSMAIGLLILREGKRLGVRRLVLLRMAGNLFVDWLAGLVPGVDIVLDTVYKANMKNLALLEREVARES